MAAAAALLENAGAREAAPWDGLRGEEERGGGAGRGCFFHAILSLAYSFPLLPSPMRPFKLHSSHPSGVEPLVGPISLC